MAIKMNSNQELVSHIRQRAILYIDNSERSERVLDAMLNVDRADFLPDNLVPKAYEDQPLSIGFGQTCSQPSMVAFMVDKLEIKSGHRVLEIGAGCGYAASVAAALCAPGGRVFACEIVEGLAKQLQETFSYPGSIIDVYPGDGSAGLTEQAPFDRILLSAGVRGTGFSEELLLKQLTDDGILLYPETYGSMYRVRLHSGKIAKKDTWYGVSFVPLLGENS
jgi:protein-L-isoaspartate(D-aspartate) O-methyltransferase